MNEPTQPLAITPAKKPARYTGEILLRTRPKTYRKVIELLSLGRSINSIVHECKVTENTVLGIRTRDEATITERKNELVFMLQDISHISGARVMDTAGKASCRDAVIALGVSVDKTLALLGQSPTVQVANIILPSEAERHDRRLLHDKLDAIASKLNS